MRVDVEHDRVGIRLRAAQLPERSVRHEDLVSHAADVEDDAAIQASLHHSAFESPDHALVLPRPRGSSSLEGAASFT